MIKMTISYDGELRCTVVHEPSKCSLHTDAPTDHCGKGENFSPTDLVATALGTCIATVMAIYAQQHSVELRGMKVDVEKHMSENPRRIGKITVSVHLPKTLEERHKKAMEAAARHCPVHKSLHPDIETPIVFHYE